jgi:hypothetical protein
VVTQISTQLDNLRLAFPECRAIAYADLGAQMILVKSSAAEVPQERWDELCVTGFDLMSGEPAQLALRAMSSGTVAAQALVIQVEEMAVFLRSGWNEDDAIFCVADLTLPVRAFVDEAGALLDWIARDD